MPVTGVPAQSSLPPRRSVGPTPHRQVYGIPHPDGVALIASNWGGAKNPPAWKKYEARAGERQIEAFVLRRN